MNHTTRSSLLIALLLSFSSSLALAQGGDAGGGTNGDASAGSTGVGNSAPSGASTPSSDGNASASGTGSASASTSTGSGTSTASGSTSSGNTSSGMTSGEGVSGTASPAPPPAGSGVGEEAAEDCEEQPVFDPSTPRFELQLGGGYSALFHTWRQSSDSFMTVGNHQEGLWHGPLFRGEVAFAFGGVSISAIYTHLWLTHDGVPDNVELGLLSGEVGVQCACRGNIYVWSFGIEIGGNLIGPGTVFASIEHRSMFYLWEGLFIGFDVDVATFIGMTMGGPSGGGILGSLFLGYSLG